MWLRRSGALQEVNLPNLLLKVVHGRGHAQLGLDISQAGHSTTALGSLCQC